MKQGETGYTLVELLVCIAVIGVLSLGAFDLMTSLLHSAITAQRQAVASTLATNQMEYIKALPYDRLAIAGGLIVSANPMPATSVKTVEGVKYTVTTRIDYADDAYDGCGSYSPASLKPQYCRSYPPPTGAPAVDNNPGDYKDVHVIVTDISGTQLAILDTHVTALVAETASNTGALFVNVIDGSGSPIEGATVTITNTNAAILATPLSGQTDQNGNIIAYDLPPSTGTNRYVFSATYPGYSSLTSLAPVGGLTPVSASQNLTSQSSASVTLKLFPMGTNSLIVETTDTSSTPLGGMKLYIKGGYKKYSTATDTSYCYDNMNTLAANCSGTSAATDTRPTTDATTGLLALSNLVPGPYIFCGDPAAATTNCKIGGVGSTYYVAAAVPYSSPFQPITVPTYDASNPPATTFDYGGTPYLQKVRLMMTSSSTFPRITSLSPFGVSLADPSISNLGVTIKGVNLCSGSCALTQVKFLQGAATYTATCTGTTTAGITTLNCTVNLTGASAGNTRLSVKVGANTLVLPDVPLLGGILVTP